MFFLPSRKDKRVCTRTIDGRTGVNVSVSDQQIFELVIDLRVCACACVCACVSARGWQRRSGGRYDRLAGHAATFMPPPSCCCRVFGAVRHRRLFCNSVDSAQPLLQIGCRVLHLAAGNRQIAPHALEVLVAGDVPRRLRAAGVCGEIVAALEIE